VPRYRAMSAGTLAIVTGAGSGIGRASARRFAADGATVIAADLDLDAAEETCRGLPNATAAQVDVTRREDVERLVEPHERIDVYFNNAGVPARIKPLAQLTREEWDRTLDVNLTALFVAAQVVAPKLRHGGLLLVTASIIANRPRPGLAAYVASKAGVVGLARALATELAPDVRVNVINPGPANTPMLDHFGFETDPAQALPLKRLIEPEDIAGAAAYLASDDARAITGAVFNVDAGRDL
jgi:3-oxoacyl-[acyl-carrier protein] reductase